MIQYAISVRLTVGPESPERQIWKHTDTLPAGTIVRIFAGTVRPLANGDRAWYRSDLHYEIATTGDVNALNAWRHYLTILGGETHETGKTD